MRARTTRSESAEKTVRDIRRATRRQYSAEEKIRIVLEGLGARPASPSSAASRKEGIAQSMYFGWSKEFLEAGKRRLAGDSAREATSDEVKTLRAESRQLKETLAEATLENRLLKKRMARPIRKWVRHDNLSSLHQRIRSRGDSPAKMEIRASWS